MGILYRIAAYIGILAAAFGAGMIRGCIAERDAWEAKAAQAELEVSRETARRKQAQDELVTQSREREAKLIADRSRADTALRLFLDSLKGGSGNTPAAQGSKTDQTVRVILGECSQELTTMASNADRAVAAGELCAAIYDSLTNRQKVKSFVKEATK